MTNFTTPVGRIVQGDCYKPQQQRELNGKPKLNKEGQPAMQYYVALAVPKSDPAWAPFHALLAAEARAAWPQYHAPDGRCTNPSFASKITDGDGHDEKGKPHATKEGFAGHWIVKCASSYAPKSYEKNEQLGYVETAPGRIKRGDYVRISGSTSSNASSVSPGMYMNLNMIAFEREGAAIVSGPSAEEAFGPASGVVAPKPVTAAAAGIVTPPAPQYTGYMAPPPAPPVATGPTMLPAANGVSYDAYIAGGWTHGQMVEKGLVAA